MTDTIIDAEQFLRGEALLTELMTAMRRTECDEPDLDALSPFDRATFRQYAGACVNTLLPRVRQLVAEKFELAEHLDKTIALAAAEVTRANTAEAKIAELTKALDVTDDALRSATLNGRSRRDHNILTDNRALLDRAALAKGGGE